MRVIFTKGLLAGNVVEFRERLIRIGRGEENELCLMTNGVSRRHGQLRRDDDGRWLITDCGSTNGIKVNGTRITSETAVGEGDDIEIGEQSMRIDLSDEESSAADTRFADSPAEVKITMPIPEAMLDTSSVTTTIDLPPAEEEEKKEPAAPAATSIPSFFGGGAAAEKKKSSGGDPGTRTRRIVMGVIFYLALLIIVLGVISFCIKKFSPRPAAAPAAAQQPEEEGDFAFRYERLILRRNNIFRFELAVENNSASMTLDDIRHHRSLHLPIKEPRGVRAFRDAIRASEITKLTPPPAPRERQSVRRRITVVTDGRIVSFEIDGETVPPEVLRVEDAVDHFAETYGLKTISLTPEQLLELAGESFTKAEDLYENREANYGNLREAIRRYAQAVSYLEQFSPRPKLWAIASKRLAEAQALRKQRFKELNFELIRQEKLGNKEQMRQVLRQIMDLVDSDTRQYEQARLKLFHLDNSGRRR